MKQKVVQQSIIYQAKNGAIELRGDVAHETIWATQEQIASAFEVNIPTINEHIKNIYSTGELSENPTLRKFRIVQKEGRRKIERDMNHYNLDMIISVGYRVNSKRATQFRIWATRILKTHIVKGYTIDRKRIAKNYDAFMKSVSEIQTLLPSSTEVDPKNVIDLIKEFAHTWFSLDAYDRDVFTGVGVTKKSLVMTSDELLGDVDLLKKELMRKGEASELFAVERSKEAIEGIVGNILQSFGGEDVYPSIEQKAAHLLYFIVKNHPFVDGNKRTGAFAFVWFLNRAKRLDSKKLSPHALTVLTLLIAESAPSKKDTIIGLITMLLGK